jgi:hypothetical protein
MQSGDDSTDEVMVDNGLVLVVDSAITDELQLE